MSAPFFQIITTDVHGVVKTDPVSASGDDKAAMTAFRDRINKLVRDPSIKEVVSINDWGGRETHKMTEGTIRRGRGR